MKAQVAARRSREIGRCVLTTGSAQLRDLALGAVCPAPIPSALQSSDGGDSLCLQWQ